MRIFAILSCCLFAGAAAAEDAVVRIAVLANRGAAEGKQRWQPTANYLNEQIPSYKFEIVPLDFSEISKAVEAKSVDFVVANSGIYVELEVKHGVARIVTLKNLRQGIVCKEFGGVIFTRADRTDIQQIADLKGKSFMAVDERSLGGWMMAWREIKAQGVDPYTDFKKLSFGGTHDAVLPEVLEGRVDAGTVRTDLFERIAAEGKIDLTTTFKILNPQPQTPEFPFLRSTRLYPEWPVAKCRHTPDELATKVAIALMQMPPDSPAAKAAECIGWTVPLDYSPVHDCMKELRTGPYTEYGKVTPQQVLAEYFYWIAGTLAGILILGVAVLYVSRLNRNLNKLRANLEQELIERRRAEASLKAARDELETRVAERTAELAKANEGLRAEIASRKELEQRLVHAQKMEAIGQLAGGLAHDFNNLLCIIQGCTNLLMLRSRNDPALQADTEMIQNAVQRGSSLTRQLLAFSRRQVLAPRVFAINAVVRNMEGLLHRVLGANIRLKLALDHELGNIKADPGQIEQTILNLCLNARDAMPQGGELSITTSNLELNDSPSNALGGSFPSARPGPYVMLRVTDTGCGMDPQTQARVFEPFFTTKGPGKGNGLGLATVYGIVKQSEGLISFSSQPGAGTTFTILMPRVFSAADDITLPSGGDSGARSETILVVEDEDSVRSVFQRLLQEKGYTVLAAANGSSALGIFQAEADKIDVVITDMVMPGMNGWELGQHIRRLRPNVPIIYMSGYMPDPAVRGEILGPNTAFLEKPCAADALEQKLRELLAAGAAHGT